MNDLFLGLIAAAVVVMAIVQVVVVIVDRARGPQHRRGGIAARAGRAARLSPTCRRCRPTRRASVRPSARRWSGCRKRWMRCSIESTPRRCASNRRCRRFRTASWRRRGRIRHPAGDSRVFLGEPRSAERPAFPADAGRGRRRVVHRLNIAFDAGGATGV